MPRPRVLEKRFVAPIVFDEKLYLQLSEAARARGMSISALIRQIVTDYLSSISVSQQGEDPPKIDDPPNIDPVLKMDLEEFEEELARADSALASIERELARNPHLARPIANPLLQSMRQSLLSSISNIEEKLGRLRSRYYSLKRIARDSGEMEKLAARLYDLKKRIKNARKQLGVKA